MRGHHAPEVVGPPARNLETKGARASGASTRSSRTSQSASSNGKIRSLCQIRNWRIGTPERRRKVTPEFKDEAVRMVIETSRPIADMAREIHVNKGILAHERASFIVTHDSVRARVVTMHAVL